MNIEIICPHCQSPALVPKSAEGSKGKCAICGGVVEVPYLTAKMCTACGTDVAKIKRIKDDSGNYFCIPCFRKKRQDAKAGKAAAAVQTAAMQQCIECGQFFAPEELLDNHGKPVCKDCFVDAIAARSVDKGSLATSACPICSQLFPSKEMFNNAGRLVCKTCYMELFTGRGEGANLPEAGEANEGGQKLWSKLKGAIKLPRKDGE